MSEPRDELSGGREPDRDRPARRPLLPGWSLSGWVSAHRPLAVVGAVVAVTLFATGQWAWQRTHPPTAAQGLHVRVDPSEYLLPGAFDGQGRADMLVLLRVDVDAGVGGPVQLVGLVGGGITADEVHDVSGGGSAFAVRARVSCDQWAGGNGMHAQFRVGADLAELVDIPLQTGHNPPIGAQVTVPCKRFATSHPLRLTVFSVSLEPSDPAVRTTWTVVNRSASAITLSDDLVIPVLGPLAPPLRPLPPTETTVLAPHGTATVFRKVAVTSCLDPESLDPANANVSLTGNVTLSGGGNGVTQLALPEQFVTQLFSTARDVCRGAPDLHGTKVTLRLHPAPPGLGQAELTADGRVGLPGPWTVEFGDLSAITSDQQIVAGSTTQRLDGPAQLALSAGWTIRTCTATVTAPAERRPTATVTVTGLRTYPYALPLTVVGQSSCTPGDVRS